MIMGRHYRHSSNLARNISFTHENKISITPAGWQSGLLEVMPSRVQAIFHDRMQDRMKHRRQ
jgi:hypothetical protein